VSVDAPSLTWMRPRSDWGRVWTREPDAFLQREIDAIVPPTDKTSRLVLWWWAGDPWYPVERWTLLQAVPLTALPPGWYRDALADALQGPHPRSTGHRRVEQQPDGTVTYHEWVGGPSRGVGITTLEWEVYQSTGLWGRPWWIVQGDGGGHRYALSQEERQMVRVLTGGAMTDAPKPGAAPYADPDARLLERIMQFDRLQKWPAFARDAADRLAAMDQEAIAAKAEYRRLLWRHIAAQVGAHTNELMWAIRNDPSIPRGYAWQRPAGAPDEQEAEAVFLNTH
jgi:hypothetical protein